MAQDTKGQPADLPNRPLFRSLFCEVWNEPKLLPSNYSTWKSHGVRESIASGPYTEIAQLRNPWKQAVGKPLWKESFRKLKTRIWRCFPQSMDVTDVTLYPVEVGDSANGAAMVCCKTNHESTRFFVKIILDQEAKETQAEFELQNQYHRFDLTVKALGVDTQCLPHLIVMEFVPLILRTVIHESLSFDQTEWLYEHLLQLISDMLDRNLNHPDLHIGNIGILTDAQQRFHKLVFLDFGPSGWYSDASITTTIEGRAEYYHTKLLKSLYFNTSCTEGTPMARWLCTRLCHTRVRSDTAAACKTQE